jgi:[NiFe] hydrogenase diaphorase moiety large subunit
MKTTIVDILKTYESDASRLMDMLHAIQKEYGYIEDKHVAELSTALEMSEIDIRQCASFYHLFETKPTSHRIYLNDSVVAQMKGRQEVLEAFEKELGISVEQISEDGIALRRTAGMGMNDQEPAALIDDVVFPNLTPERATAIIKGFREGKNVEELFYQEVGDGNNAHPLLNSMVNNNVRKAGKVLDEFYKPWTALKKAVAKSELEVIGIVRTSGLRGRGGAGFPTGMKWEFCRASQGAKKYIICNADEGEPGTYKDRVLLTENPLMLIEGMCIAAYAIGAQEGIIYLRQEYRYMEKFLNMKLDEARSNNMLGNSILRNDNFNFDIRIQFGAGAYICGEESALIESMEGKRGEPRFKPPFPVQSGYKNMPTSVNNVETLVTICRIIERGGEWYRGFGNNHSVGTKLLSISGDCSRPGVYEVEWGITIRQMLGMIGAQDTVAVQVGGPSGSLIGEADFDHQLCYNDLPTGGSMMVFNSTRNLLKDVVLNFTDFFIDESCGSCVSCRATVQQMQKKLVKILDGYGVESDLDDLKSWAKTTLVSRCGLGQTAANPIVSSLKNFPHLYRELIQEDKDFVSTFDMDAAIAESCKVVGREAVV